MSKIKESFNKLKMMIFSAFNSKPVEVLGTVVGLFIVTIVIIYCFALGFALVLIATFHVLVSLF